MNCPKCGAPLLQGAGFCGACGYRLTAAAPSTQATTGNAATHGIHIDEDAKGQGGGYKYEVLHQPAFSLAVIQLQAEQSIQAEA
ncbi:MAG TPA: zinc ribbon domain-containing protein, partial [Pyrinomonadaceae bacterium]|nr:zinc ribbon domain-containing protein [Pyrinomonadaceae bacterium]